MWKDVNCEPGQNNRRGLFGKLASSNFSSFPYKNFSPHQKQTHKKEIYKGRQKRRRKMANLPLLNLSHTLTTFSSKTTIKASSNGTLHFCSLYVMIII